MVNNLYMIVHQKMDSSMKMHASGLFEYKAVEYGNMDLGKITYFDCKLLQCVGSLEPATCLLKIDLFFERLELHCFKNNRVCTTFKLQPIV